MHGHTSYSFNSMTIAHSPRPTRHSRWRTIAVLLAASIGVSLQNSSAAQNSGPAQADASDKQALKTLVRDLGHVEVTRREQATEALLVATPRAAVVALLIDQLPELPPEPEQLFGGFAVGLAATADRSEFELAPELECAEFYVSDERQETPLQSWVRNRYDLADPRMTPSVLSAWVLGRMGTDADAAFDRLITGIQHGDLFTDFQSRWSLSQLGPSRALDVLGTGTLYPWVRARVAVASYDGAVPATVMGEWLQSENSDVAEAALLAATLSHAPHPWVVSALIKLARKTGYDGPVRALRAMGVLGLPDLALLLTEASSKPKHTLILATIARVLEDAAATPTKLPSTLVPEFIGCALGDDLQSAALALEALRSCKLLDAQKRRLRRQVQFFCGRENETARWLGYSNLGTFGFDAIDSAMATHGLDDDFDNIAWQASLAFVRMGIAPPETARVCLAELGSRGNEQALRWILARWFEDDSQVTEFTNQGDRTSAYVAAVRGAIAHDDLAVVRAMASDKLYDSTPGIWDHSKFIPHVMRCMGSITSERLNKLLELDDLEIDARRAIVTLTDDLPREEALPTLIRAMGIKQSTADSAWFEMHLGEDAESHGATLVLDALQELAKYPRAALMPHRKLFEAILPTQTVARPIAAEILTRLD